MTDKTLVATWVRRFLLEYLVADLNLSRNTQSSYRDTLALLLPFAAKLGGKPIDRLEVECLSSDVVRRFLAHLEGERHNSVTTRNQRLAAIHAFTRFVGARSPSTSRGAPS
jgi:integrase/recombinase XerD